MTATAPMTYTPPRLTAGQLAERLTQAMTDAARGRGDTVVLEGDASVVVAGLAPLNRAGPEELAFVRAAQVSLGLGPSRVGVLLAPAGVALNEHAARAVIRVADVDLAMAVAAGLFAPPVSRVEPGVHALAFVHPSATLGEGVCIGPLASVGAGAVLGDGTVLHPHAVVMDRVTIGSSCTLWPGATVRDGCVLGDRVVLHPNTVIGSDGFGYRADPHNPGHPIVKVPQIGNVTVGDDVEVGANACIDRAALGSTVIEDLVKIDNLVQIGHNCHIKRGAILCGMVGLSGSCTIGAFATLGGGAGLPDHVSVGDGAKLAARSAPLGDVPAGETWGGSPAVPMNEYRRQMGLIKRLPEIAKALKALKGR